MKPFSYKDGVTGNGFLDIIVSNGQVLDDCTGTIVDLKKNQELIGNDVAVQYMYFPVGALVSLRCCLQSGYAAEFGQIGREGFVGFSALMGAGAATNTAIVQSSGKAYRIGVEAIQRVFDSSPQFRGVTLQYMQALMQEAAQSVICNRSHSVTQQYCRSLLLAADRLDSETVCLTHEQLAIAVGCRREAVSLVAGKLQAAGIIRYVYGRIVILDRAALEARSCECYGAVKQGFSMFFDACRIAPPTGADAKIAGA